MTHTIAAQSPQVLLEMMMERSKSGIIFSILPCIPEIFTLIRIVVTTLKHIRFANSRKDDQKNSSLLLLALALFAGSRGAVMFFMFWCSRMKN